MSIFVAKKLSALVVLLKRHAQLRFSTTDKKTLSKLTIRFSTNKNDT